MLKRLFDIIASSAGLILFFPVMLIVGVAIKCSSKGPIFFGHERAGRNRTSIKVWKFRTMVQNASKIGGPLTLGGEDPRITRIGRWLRKSKLDELPQLFNVLMGSMSLVGPRPEAWKYVELRPEAFEPVLRVRPGITDPASLVFRDEASLLAASPDPEKTYLETILPEKIRLANEYIARRSLWLDLQIILSTVISILSDRFASHPSIPVLPNVDRTK